MSFSTSPFKRALTLCLLAVLLSACHSRIYVWKEGEARKKQWAQVCKPYVMMSFLAYHHADDEVRIKSATAEESEKKKAEDIAEKKYLEELQDLGWKRTGHFHRPKFSGKSNSYKPSHGRNIQCPPPNDPEAGQGMYLDVWENKSVSPREVVLAFEGSNPELEDWLTNLRMLRFLNRSRHADQYEFVRPLASDIIDRMTQGEKAGDVRIVTTGHSLGGGLAQCVLYANAYRRDHPVDQAIVFNSTPVTGFFDSKDNREIFQSLQCRKTFPHFRIMRVFERGEILEFFRATTDLFKNPDGLIHSLKFDSKDKNNFISQHSILMLAETIRDQSRAELKYGKPTAPCNEYKGQYGSLVKWAR
jgi:hypothetical protein